MGSDWDSPKKLKGWVPAIIGFAFVGILLLTGTLDDFMNLKDDVTESAVKTIKEVSTPSEKESPIVEKPKTLEEKIREISGKNTKIVIDDTDFGKTMVIGIPPKISGKFFSDKDWIISANMDVGRIMQIVFTDSNYDNVNIVAVVLNEEFTDNYGVTSEAAAYVISLSRDTASKINWSGFIWGNPNPLPYHSIVEASKGDRAYLHSSFNIN